MVAMMVVSVGTGYRVRVLLDLDHRHGPAIRYLQFNICNTMYLGKGTHTGTDKFKARNERANVVTTDETSSSYSCCCCSVRPLWALRSTWQPSVTADKEHWREKEKEEWDFAKFKLEAKISLPERTFLDVCLSCHSYAYNRNLQKNWVPPLVLFSTYAFKVRLYWLTLLSKEDVLKV